jgi:hypothetical protein
MKTEVCGQFGEIARIDLTVSLRPITTRTAPFWTLTPMSRTLRDSTAPSAAGPCSKYCSVGNAYTI